MGRGGEGVENVIECRLRRDWRVQVSPSKQREIASLSIANSIFFWRKGLFPDSPPKSRPPVSPVFRAFKHQAPLLSSPCFPFAYCIDCCVLFVISDQL